MLVREFYMRTVEEAGAGKLSQLLAASECDGAGVRVLVHLLSEEHHLSWVGRVGLAGSQAGEEGRKDLG